MKLAFAFLAASVLFVGSVAMADVLGPVIADETAIANQWGNPQGDQLQGQLIWSNDNPGFVYFPIDFSQVGGTVTSATLNITLGWTGTTQTVTAKCLTQSFVESEATWNHASAGVLWTTPGGTTTDVGMASATVGSQATVTLDITSIVQFWKDNPTQYYGLWIRDVGGDGYFATCYNTGKEPSLTITSTPEPATMALLAIGGLGLLARRRK